MRSFALLSAALWLQAAMAAATGRHPTVPGKAFDRYVTIWLENTDYAKAAGDPNLQWLAKRALTLTNYHAVTHPSQPNYCATIAGDYFGMNHDDFTLFPNNISTIMDSLETKGISWAEYQEDMPSVGFTGMASTNRQNGANDYVRKHNPAVNYGANNIQRRLNMMKPLTHLAKDLRADKLPQWVFITPNMTSDGHDTSVATAGKWTRDLLEPLLNNKKFMQNTLVLVTFDENETYTAHNRVFALLLGDALPKHLVGKEDHSYYNHYSALATVEANWGLHHLGRFDAGANVFNFVAEQTGDTVRKWTKTPTLGQMYFNESYAGREYDKKKYTAVPWPAPNLQLEINGRTVLPEVAKQWSGSKGESIYNGALETYDGQHPPPGYGFDGSQ